MAESTIIAPNSAGTRWRVAGALLACAAVIEAYYLVHDLTLSRESAPAPKSARDAAPALAELTAAKNVVRVQRAGELVWSDGATGQPLYRKQSVLTLADSKAEVAFFDGTGLVLGENSLVQIEKQANAGRNEAIIVRLLRGSLHKTQARKTSEFPRKSGETTPAFEIAVGKITAELTPTSELSIAADPEFPGAARISVQNGEVKLEAPGLKDGTPSVVQQGEVAQIAVSNDAPTLNVRKQVFTLLSPRSGETIRTGDSTIAFRWNVQVETANGVPMELQIAEDRDFKKISKTVRIGASEPPLKFVETKVSLGAGAGKKYYWRVQGVGSSFNADAAIENFEIAGSAAPGLRFPASQATVSEGADIHFVWNAVENAVGYTLELAGETRNSRDPFWIEPKATAGEKPWRVRAKLPNGELTEWSETRVLTVMAQKPAEDLPPPPNEIADPKLEEAPFPADTTPAPTHSWLDWFIAPARAEDPKSIRVHLSWKPVPGVSRYRVQIARERTFKTIITETQTDAPKWVWEMERGMENSKGRLFYRVASVSASGTVGRYSDAKVIAIPKIQLSAEAVEKAEEQQEFSLVSPAPEPIAAAAPSPSPSPVPTPSASPAPISTPASPVAHEEPHEMVWSLGYGPGYTRVSQSGSSGSLSSVAVASPYLANNLRLNLDRDDDWSASISANFGSFQKNASGDPRETAQPKLSASRFSANFVQWSQSEKDWETGFGLTLDRSFRFAKSGLQTLETQSSLSLGPGVWVYRDFPDANGFLPISIGASLLTPVTGILYKGHFSINTSVWSEWAVLQLNENWLSLKFEAQASFSHWGAGSSGADANLSSWNLLIAPTFYFNSSERASP